jgi:hypothetical protein
MIHEETRQLRVHVTCCGCCSKPSVCGSNTRHASFARYTRCGCCFKTSVCDATLVMHAMHDTLAAGVALKQACVMQHSSCKLCTIHSLWVLLSTMRVWCNTRHASFARYTCCWCCSQPSFCGATLECKLLHETCFCVALN